VLLAHLRELLLDRLDDLPAALLAPERAGAAT
jgi:hypothetical protein